MRSRTFRFAVYALLVIGIVAAELTFVRHIYDRAENYRRSAVRQLTDMGQTISDAGISDNEKSELLRDTISSIGKMSPRPKQTR
jgi:hypothetical protein